MNDKYDFINELIKNKNLSNIQKEKILALASKEILKDKSVGNQLEKRVEIIEQEINEIKTLPQKVNPTNSNIATVVKRTNLPKYINPFSKNGLKNFLIAYNQDEILKYTCHLIDSEKVILNINEQCKTEFYNVEKHQQLIVESFKELVKKFYVSTHLSNLIYVYLTGKTFTENNIKWSSERIETNWSSEKLKEWSKKNINIVPNPELNIVKIYRSKGYRLNEFIISKLTGKRIFLFSELVIHFKNLFHLRADNSLKTIVEFINLSEYKQKIIFNIDKKSFLETIELFTDVDKLIQAYREILKIILDVSYKNQLNTPHVDLFFLEKDSSVEFIIHHKNVPHYFKSPKASLRIGQSQTELIKNQINGLCHLHVQAKFEDGKHYEINLWNGLQIGKKEIESLEGVKYILKFK